MELMCHPSHPETLPCFQSQSTTEEAECCLDQLYILNRLPFSLNTIFVMDMHKDALSMMWLTVWRTKFCTIPIGCQGAVATPSPLQSFANVSRIILILTRVFYIGLCSCFNRTQADPQLRDSPNSSCLLAAGQGAGEGTLQNKG